MANGCFKSNRSIDRVSPQIPQVSMKQALVDAPLRTFPGLYQNCTQSLSSRERFRTWRRNLSPSRQAPREDSPKDSSRMVPSCRRVRPACATPQVVEGLTDRIWRFQAGGQGASGSVACCQPGRSSEIALPDDPATPGWGTWTVPVLDGVQL